MTTLAAVLAMPMFGMLAFSIDIGYLEVVQDECHNVADAAALAGLSELDQYSTWSSLTDSATRKTIQTNAITAVRAEAKKYVQANTAGGVSLTIDSTNDVTVGYWDATKKTFTATNPPDSNWPNAVKVTVRRDSTTDSSGTATGNGAVTLFFGPVLGVKTVAVTQTSTAAANPTAPSVASLGSNSVTVTTGGLLPFAVDVDSWQYYLRHGMPGPGGTSVDNYGIPSGLGVANDNTKPDGIPEFQAYPPPSLIHPSQKGLLSFDPSGFSGNGNVISDWINPGPSPSDLVSLFGSSGFVPPVDLYGTPGNKVGHFSDITGEIRTMPLIDYADSTTGNHGQYHVVSVVPVIVVYGPDSSAIWVQPYAGTIPAAQAGTSPASGYTYTYESGVSVTVPAFGSGIRPSSYRAYMLVQ